MKTPTISLKSSLIFSDYFELNYYAEDVLAYFGYAYQKQEYNLPNTTRELENINYLKVWLEKNLLNVNLTSETAKREFLIAPILSAVADWTATTIKVEYPMVINEQLKGKLDYYLHSKNNLLVIEAKNADLEKGFIQLAVELIALDKWIEDDNSIEQLYGAISVGNIWQFAILERTAKRVIHDINLYKVPKEVEILIRILVAILENEST